MNDPGRTGARSNHNIDADVSRRNSGNSSGEAPQIAQQDALLNAARRVVGSGLNGQAGHDGHLADNAHSASRTATTTAQGSRRRIDRLLDEYSESHQNFVNKLVHWFAVPVIAWCVLALAWVTPFPAAWQVSAFEILGGLNWAWVIAGLATIYYFTLSVPLALGMMAFVAGCFTLIVAYLNWGDLPLWQFAIALFLGAWVFQFIGHKIEGRSPSFFKDLQFLLIGPAWLMGFLFRLFHVRY